MSWTRRFLPTNFLSYPCLYTYINAKTEHIITVVSFEWSDITEFSNKSSETSVMSSKIKKIILLYLNLSCFIASSSEYLQKRSRFIFWRLHQKIFWRCTEESNKTRPYLQHRSSSNTNWYQNVFWGESFCF